MHRDVKTGRESSKPKRDICGSDRCAVVSNVCEPYRDEFCTRNGKFLVLLRVCGKAGKSRLILWLGSWFREFHFLLSEDGVANGRCRYEVLQHKSMD